MGNNYLISIGNSGEYSVAAELERRGFTAAVPMSNTKDFDISDQAADRMILSHTKRPN